MVIPQEAIEAAEQAVSDAMYKYGPDGHIDGYQEIARAALESAAFLAAQALEDAAEAIDADPYDDLDPFYAGWLRDRAQKIREEA
jgi:hypothetical protein